MSIDETTIVHVIPNQSNPRELFKQWNKKKETNIKCSKVDCSNDSECARCHNLGINSNNQTPHNSSWLLKVEGDLLVKDKYYNE